MYSQVLGEDGGSLPALKVSDYMRLFLGGTLLSPGIGL